METNVLPEISLTVWDQWIIGKNKEKKISSENLTVTSEQSNEVPKKSSVL